MAHGDNQLVGKYYSGNYTYVRLSSRNHKILSSFQYKKYLYIININNKFPEDAFNLELFIPDFKIFIYNLNDQPITNDSLDLLNDVKEGNYNSTEWRIDIFILNDILIKVFEKYWELFDSLVMGDYVWKYFKTPLSLNFIEKIILSSQNNRIILSGHDNFWHSKLGGDVDYDLWISLFFNSIGYYQDPSTGMNSGYCIPELPNLENCFRFIRKFKNLIDWSVVQAYLPSMFTYDLIREYEEYLIFHDNVITPDNNKLNTNKNHEGKSLDMTTSNLCKENNIYKDSNYYNKIGQRYYKRTMSPFILSKTEILNSSFTNDLGIVPLSKLQRVQWSLPILVKFQNNFCWDSLSENKFLPWSIELVYVFRDKWNWEKLSRNNALRFSVDVLDLFRLTINYQSLSENDNVDWSKLSRTLISSKTKLNWNVLSNNPSIDENFVNDNNEYIVFSSPKIMKEGISKFDRPLPYESDKCLSSNCGITWTDFLIQNYLKKIDFWLISIFGNISSDLVMKYAAYFDESRRINKSSRKMGDDWIEVHKFASGWQNLSRNKSFKPTKRFLEFAELREVRNYKEFENESLGNVIDPVRSEFEIIKVSDLFKKHVVEF